MRLVRRSEWSRTRARKNSPLDCSLPCLRRAVLFESHRET
nr:MAG TPA_asm: hypothetical protein [Caudoviricetes sp.]